MKLIYFVHKQQQMSEKPSGRQGKPETRGMLVLEAIVFCLLLACIKGEECKSVPSNNNGSCKICYRNNYFASCKISSESMERQVNRSDCIAECCNASSSNITSQISICSNQKVAIVSTQTDTESATFLLIIFLTIPGVVCFYCGCSYCLRKKREMQAQILASQQEINLENFDMDAIGPYYLQSDQNCSICISDGCEIITKCGHMYHFECLTAWVKKIHKCPMCVSTELNPIVFYCTKCFRSVKLGIMASRQNPQEHPSVVCNGCRQENQRENCEISVHYESEDDAKSKQQKDAGMNQIQSSKGLVLS